MPLLSQRTAATTWGIRRATIANDIKTGKLSATRDGIDPAEMQRVYGLPKEGGTGTGPVPVPGTGTGHPVDREIEAMNRLIERLETELAESKAREAESRAMAERIMTQSLALLPAPKPEPEPEVKKKPGLVARLFGKG